MTALDGLLANPGLYYLAIVLLGLCVGSFLNVVAHRLPLMMERAWKSECRLLLELPEAAAETPLTLSAPRSRCPHCASLIRAYQNIPVFSWLWLRGRCAECGKAISAQYPLVEACTALLSVACAVVFGPTLALVAALGITWTLIALTVIDLRTQLLPDQLTLPLMWAGLLFSLSGTFCTPVESIVGAAAGYLSLWSVYQLFRLLTGREGMGFGDFKLLAALGAWFGWQALPPIILMSSLIGAVVGLSLILFRGHDRQVPIPFGPYLAGAGWCQLLWGPEIFAMWLRPVAG